MGQIRVAQSTVTVSFAAGDRLTTNSIGSPSTAMNDDRTAPKGSNDSSGDGGGGGRGRRGCTRRLVALAGAAWISWGPLRWRRRRRRSNRTHWVVQGIAEITRTDNNLE